MNQLKYRIVEKDGRYAIQKARYSQKGVEYTDVFYREVKFPFRKTLVPQYEFAGNDYTEHWEFPQQKTYCRKSPELESDGWSFLGVSYMAYDSFYIYIKTYPTHQEACDALRELLWEYHVEPTRKQIENKEWQPAGK